MSTNEKWFWAIIITICAISILRRILKSPFKYPYFCHEFDVTGKRKPQKNDLIDEYLNTSGFEEIEEHERKIKNWKESSKRLVEVS